MTLPDLVCFSHLPWKHVFQRPHHLMTRAARDRRVYWIEEPARAMRPRVTVRTVDGGIRVVRIALPGDVDDPGRRSRLATLLDGFLAAEGVRRPVAWYYTPLALQWSTHLDAAAVVYDCMDELSAFKKASPELPRWERALLDRADVVFTGGRSLYEAKRGAHANVHAFPSSVDVAHFATARNGLPDPDDQAGLPRPRLGWFGVIDERMDIDLVRRVATARPDWVIVLIGPVAKVDPRRIPALSNVHRLGLRSYDELPAYLGGWDVAIMPFARNEATRFISPTKTPEYLAGGRPVVSTSITDVVRPYGDRGFVRIADTADDFIAACEAALADPFPAGLAAVDAFLAGMSWNRTWEQMDGLVAQAISGRAAAGRAAAGRARSAADRNERARRTAVRRPVPAGPAATPGVAAAAAAALASRSAARASSAAVPRTSAGRTNTR